ncbi:MAG: heme-binding protein [Syntrophobacteraceae bacterium]|jgi:uncharacterized protein GlcG (DUF336 family)
MKISYSLARILSHIAETQAAAVGVPMAIAMVDAEGGLLFFARMDGALPASTEIAVSKAYTSAVLRMSTQELGRLARPGEVLYGIQHTHNGRIVLFGGGLPLRLGGRVAGAIGISGGSVEEDIQVAESVANALELMECWFEYLKGTLPSKPLEGNRADRLESKLQEVLEQMNCDLPPGTASILSGAIVIAATNEPCSSRP